MSLLKLKRLCLNIATHCSALAEAGDIIATGCWHSCLAEHIAASCCRLLVYARTHSHTVSQSPHSHIVIWSQQPHLLLLLAAGYFPTHTLTEDYALGMEMRRKGWRGMYVEDELVRGSAPDKVRAAFGQRSRWCKVGSMFL